MLKHYYAGLHESCCNIPDENSSVMVALASCWGFVDALHRIREIAQSTPGINAKHLEMRVFLESTKLAEEFRHYIQHVRGELANNPTNPFPVWGSLSWVDKINPERSYIALLGAQVQETGYTGCVFDNQIKKWVSKVCLGVNQHSFNFDPIYEASLRFQTFIIPQIIDGASNEIKLHEKLPIMTVDFKI